MLSRINQLFIIICINILIISIAKAESKTVIQNIRALTASINKELTSYEENKKSLLGFSTEGGSLIYYLDNDEVKKIHVIYFGETGKMLGDYYLHKEHLIFAHTKKIDYNEPFGKIAHTQENIYYFNNHKMIKWVNADGVAISYDSPEFEKEQQSVLKSLDELLTFINLPYQCIESAGNKLISCDKTNN